MKRLLFALLFLVSGTAQAFSPFIFCNNPDAPKEYLHYQQFDADFPITDWTVVAGTPVSGATLSGTPPLASGATGLDIAASEQQEIYYYNTLIPSTYYFRLDIMFTASTLTTPGDQYFFFAGNQTNGNPASLNTFWLYLENQGGALQLASWGNSSWGVLSSSISLNTWYRITGKIDTAVPANSWVKLNGGAAQTFSPFNIADIYFWIGDLKNSQKAAMQVGSFLINGTEISGNDINNP